jgi:hypothetical protein
MMALGKDTEQVDRFRQYVINLPDLTNWILAAKSTRMRIKSFWTGANGGPFAAMMATQIRVEPPKVIKINGVKTPFIEVNDFYVADEYR